MFKRGMLRNFSFERHSSDQIGRPPLREQTRIQVGGLLGACRPDRREHACADRLKYACEPRCHLTIPVLDSMARVPVLVKIFNVRDMPPA